MTGRQLPKNNILSGGRPLAEKENLNCDNCPRGEKEVGRRKMEILRDSALLALVEKNDIIDGLIHASCTPPSEKEEELMQEVEALRLRVAEMEEESK